MHAYIVIVKPRSLDLREHWPVHEYISIVPSIPITGHLATQPDVRLCNWAAAGHPCGIVILACFIACIKRSKQAGRSHKDCP